MSGTGAVHLEYLDLAIAAVLILLAGGLSIVLKLGIARRLFIASLRTVVQLMLIGYVLTFVFGMNHIILILTLALVMATIAGRAGVRRASRRFPGDVWFGIFTLILTGFLTTYLVTSVIIQVEPWYRPQYVIPILGMILGNGLTGISLSLDHLLDKLHNGRAEVEMELAHGATAWEAALGPLRGSIRLGMIPIINSMMVVGMVSLPGMMTGQILQGADPLEAVKYQIVVMFMIAFATTMGCVFINLLAFQRLFNSRHQLRAQLISKR